MGKHLHLKRAAFLVPVQPAARIQAVFQGRLMELHESGDLFRRPDVRHLQVKEFFPAVAVLFNGRIVYCKETERLIVVDIHRDGQLIK